MRLLKEIKPHFHGVILAVGDEIRVAIAESPKRPEVVLVYRG